LAASAFVVLSHFQVHPLLRARRAGEHRADLSPDLGLTTVEVALQPEGVRLPGGTTLPWETVEEISLAENSCFVLEKGEPRKIQLFSELTNRLYSMLPARGAPTMLVSGIPMHRIKGTEPYRDTLEKIKVLKPVVGHVLDTATGLGYTAIEAAKSADRVVTAELDPAVLEIARLNPWSQALFDNPKITQRVGDSWDIVEEFDDKVFTCILHDPPALSLAGHLYSGEFYAQLYRVLRRGGRLFHYVGNPESKSGHSHTRGVVRRLQEVGFSRVERRPRAFGVVAFK
jgi:predicted methyltransferase